MIRRKRVEAAKLSRLQKYPEHLGIKEKVLLLAFRTRYIYSNATLEFVRTGREARRVLKQLLSAGLLVRHKMNNGGSFMWRYSIPKGAMESIQKEYQRAGLL